MKPLSRLTILVLLSLFVVDAASAQGVFGRILDATERGAENAVSREVQNRSDRAVTGLIGTASDAIVCTFTDEACIEEARQRGEHVVLTDAEGNPVDASGHPVENPNDAVLPPAPGTGVWVNYDFIPGNRVLFYEDYTQDRVGDFPRRLEFLNGNWEIAEWQGRRLLRNTGPRHAAILIPLQEELPERFTIETEVYFPHSNQRFVLLTQPTQGYYNSVDYNYFQISAVHGTGVHANRNQGLSESFENDARINESLVPIRIMVDGEYAKMYVAENRTANIPNAVLPRSEALQLINIYSASEENPMYIGSIRIAAGGRDLYADLEANGRVATHGIYFATASAAIRPESTPTLQEIIDLLQQHPDLRLRIEGHTDNTGSAETNQTLSEQRAGAIRNYLVQQGIDGGRLEAAGFGQTQPSADNATPEGRQQNRRVELVRI